MKEHRHYDFDIRHDELCQVDWYAFRSKAKVRVDDGKSVIKNWPADARVQIDADSPVKKPGDMLANDEDVMIVAAHAKEIMETFTKPAEVEFLRITVCDKKGRQVGGQYFVVNPQITCDAMDLGASDLYWDSDGEVYRINSIVLQREKVESLPAICRLKYALKKVIINYPLALALYDKKCLLPWMRLVYNDAPEVAEWREKTGIPANASYQQLSVTHQFIDAVKDNKKARVTKLLEQKPFLNAFDTLRHGTTALMEAAKNGHAELVKLLIKAGCSLDVRNDEGITALYLAVQEEKEACVRTLLEAGANPNLPRLETDEPDKVIGYPLEHAVYRKFEDIVALLLQHKADPNLADHDGKIPFHDAEDEKTFQLLFDAGTHPNAQSPYFSTPFHIVAGAGSAKLLEAMLQKGGLVNSTDSYSKTTPLMEAAAGGKLENMGFLLAHGAKLETKDKKGLTAIQHAFNNKHYEAVALLVENGAAADKKMLQRIEKLRENRKELAFDKYAEEMAAYILNIIGKHTSKIKFAPQNLQVNFDKEGALDFFALTGKTEKQAFEYHQDKEAANAPVGFKEGNVQQLCTDFLKKQQLKPRDFSVDPILSWQLHKHLSSILDQIDGHPISLLMIIDRYQNFESLSVTKRKMLSAYNKLAARKGSLSDLATLCLVSPHEQKELLQLFEAPPATYALDELCKALTDAAVETILQHHDTLKHPVTKVKLLYEDFGSMLPSFIELGFTKGKSQYWPIRVPDSPLPSHIDNMHEEDFLLPEFIKKHKVKQLEWGDLFQLPHSLLRMELLLAAQAVVQHLKNKKVPMANDVLACIGDGEEDSDDLDGYTGLVQKDLQKKLKDAKLLKAFSELMYHSKEKQAWLQKLPTMKKIDMSNSWLGC